MVKGKLPAKLDARASKSVHGSAAFTSEHLRAGYRKTAPLGQPPAISPGAITPRATSGADYKAINPQPTTVPQSIAARPAAQTPIGHMPPRPRGRIKGVGPVHEGPFSNRES